MKEQATINQVTMSEQAYQIMSKYILNGSWKPGKKIKIRDTAKLLNISEMPVREAVRILVENGLAVHRPHKGAVVTKLSTRELNDYYKVRILLESEAARLGAKNITKEDLLTMREHWLALQEATKKMDSLKALEIDAEFLLVLYNSCGNEVLIKQIQSIWKRVQPYKVLWAQRSLKSGFFNWEVKKKILRAAEQHDGDLAAKLTSDSLISAVNFMKKKIDN